MANKRRISNETLAQQRRARAELVKLKQAQAGQIEMKNPTPLEAAMPKTAKEKAKNIWYHDKWAIISLIVAIALIVFFCVECSNKQNFDLEAVTYTYDYITDAQLDVIADELETFCEDVDGNGEVKILPINCTYPKNNANNSNMHNSTVPKLQALLSSDKQALLFIVDKESFEFLRGIDSENALFGNGAVPIPEKTYKKVKEKTGLPLPEGLMLCYRNIDGTILEKEKNVKQYYEQAKSIVESLKDGE